MADAPQYRQLLQELVDAIDFQCDPPGGDMSDVGWDQWQAASDTQYEEALEAARAALSAPLSPDFKLQDQDLIHPTEAAVQVPLAPLQSWRCFHCDEVFYDREAALLHFGSSEADSPACTIDVVHLRDLEKQLRRHCEEDTDLWRHIYGLGSQHYIEKMREEEKGYARGLRDGRAPDEKGNGAAPLADSDLPRLVFEAVGRASLCWDPNPHGVFDTTEATKCAEQLIADVRALYVHTVGAPSDPNT